MPERLSSTNPSSLDVQTVFSAALLRHGVYSAAAHRMAITGETTQGTVHYSLHDHYSWESTAYPSQPPQPNQEAHRQLLECGAAILSLTPKASLHGGERSSYTICQPSQVCREYAIGGLFYEIDNIPALLDTPTEPNNMAIVASNEQTDSHRYVTDVRQEPELQAIYAAALKLAPGGCS